MLISHHPQSSEHLVLGDGVLLCDFDLNRALQCTDPLDAMADALCDERHRIGTTCSGSVFRAVPKEFQREQGANRLPYQGSTLLVGWRVTLSGVLQDVTEENVARLLPGDGTRDAHLFRHQPTQAAKAPLERVCWIGTTSRGLLVLELLHPLAISGAALAVKPNEAGEMTFTLLAQNDHPDDPTLPVRIYWWQEETHDIA